MCFLRGDFLPEEVFEGFFFPEQGGGKCFLEIGRVYPKIHWSLRFDPQARCRYKLAFLLSFTLSSRP